MNISYQRLYEYIITNHIKKSQISYSTQVSIINSLLIIFKLFTHCEFGTIYATFIQQIDKWNLLELVLSVTQPVSQLIQRVLNTLRLSQRLVQ